MDDVMGREGEMNAEGAAARGMVPRIAVIELPVADLRRAVGWYGELLGAKPQGEWSDEWAGVMLHLQGGAGAAGVPSIYLVKTEDRRRLTFRNTQHGYTQSVIDLYSHDPKGCYQFLKERGAEVNEVDWEAEPHRQGFGFRDCDGNSFGVCQVEFPGQGTGSKEVPNGHPFIWRIVDIALPVVDLKKAVAWYTETFGMKVVGESEGTGGTAMLCLDGGEKLGVPNLYLVETRDEQRLAFENTYTNTTHSVVDFYTENVERMLAKLHVCKVKMNGVSGFFDPDGNSLAVCNAMHQGV